MTSREKYDHWLEHAQYDMKAAEVMLNSGMWAYAVFMCQQAIEKLVKGLYGIFVDTDSVPRIHNIVRLVNDFEDKMYEPVKDDFRSLFITLSVYYLNNRYPDYKSRLADSTAEEKARTLYAQTKEAFAWLQTMRP